jgi:hypothetical protein
MNETAATLAFVEALRANAPLVALVAHRDSDIRIAASFPESGQKETQVSVSAERTTPLNEDQAPVYRTMFDICVRAKTRAKCSAVADLIGGLLVPTDSRTYFNFTGSGVVNTSTLFRSRNNIDYDSKGDKYEVSLYCLAIWREGNCP